MIAKEQRVNNIDALLKLIKRNFLVFIKNKIRMFFTLMVPIIILFVYLIFLRQLILASVSKSLIDIDSKVLSTVTDSWFLSGVVALSTITISIQTNNIIINDKENGINRDFASSPLHKTVVTLSYVIFNFIVTYILCFIFVLITFIYLAIAQEFTLNFLNVLSIIGILAFAVLNASFITTFICSFVNKEATLASIIAILSACLGFLIGTFMPLSMMPKILQDIFFFIPGTQTTALIRYSYMYAPLETFKGLLSPENFTILKNQVGYNLVFYVGEMTKAVDLTIDPTKQGGAIIGPTIQSIITASYSVIFAIFNFLSRRHTVRTNIK